MRRIEHDPVVGGNLAWSVSEIDFRAIQSERVRSNRDLFYLLVSASFIESGSDTYAGNLATYYARVPEAAEWLSEHWEAEELQHGLALRRYVEHVWPEFDWERGYERFFQEYSETCSIDQFEPTEALEMAARCVVETGTAAYYRALELASDEPVLRALTRRIANDEVRHYKHFYRFFNRFAESEQVGRARVLGASRGGSWRSRTRMPPLPCATYCAWSAGRKTSRNTKSRRSTHASAPWFAVTCPSK